MTDPVIPTIAAISSARPPQPAPSFWAIVALDVPNADGDRNAWYIQKSPDAVDRDLLVEHSTDADGDDMRWAKDQPAGVYRITMNPLSGEDWFDLNVVKVEPLYSVEPAREQGRQDVTKGGLDLAVLRAANLARQAVWCPDQVPDLSFRGNELAGEAGEAMEAAFNTIAAMGALMVAIGRASNTIKKLERERQGWAGSRATLEQLAEELADVVICADLCGITANIDLSPAVVAKFNATSEKVGLPTRLSLKEGVTEIAPAIAVDDEEAGRDEILEAALHAHQHGDEEE